jgi:hypothetical protein
MMSYAVYTKQCNDFLRRSRHNLTADVQCVRFINGLANSTLKNQAKSHRAQKGYNVTLVELQNFLNDVVTVSPELGSMRSSTSQFAQPTRKRNFDDPLVGASKIFKRNGGGRGRRRGRGGNQGGGRGQISSNTGRIDFNAIANSMTPEKRMRHMEEGLCFKCHKKGHRLFQCHELKGKAPMEAPQSKKQ